jgi:ribosomal protein S17E
MEGLQNFVKNIEPVMMKLAAGFDVSFDENKRIVQFYLEVRNVVGVPKSTEEI